MTKRGHIMKKNEFARRIKNEYFQNYLKQIYPAIIAYRNLDEVETA